MSLRPVASVQDLLCCGLLAVGIGPKSVSLTLPELHCTDMGGAIEFARFLCPDVELITTWSGTKPDSRYECRDGRWVAVRPAPGPPREP